MKKIAVLIENMFDEQELIAPYHRLREDYDVYLVGTDPDTEYKGKSGMTMKSDICTKTARTEDFDGVIIPGGFSPDYMRRHEDTIEFVKELNEKGKPIAAICHAGWMLVESVDMNGKKMTSTASIKTDMINAGAEWVDEEVVVDGNLITSRKPDDIAAMMKEFIKQLG